jgi:hypothetical protein
MIATTTAGIGPTGSVVVIALAVGSGASHGCGTMVTIVEKSVGEEE